MMSGHRLLKSSIRSVGEYLSQTTLSPASVQRTFLWENENTSALLHDLLRAWRASNPDAERGPAADEPENSVPPDAEEAGELGPAGFGEVSARSAQPALEVYFLGAVVVEPKSATHCLVFDGLQRSTALVILFSVLRDLLPADRSEVRDALDLCVNLEGKARLSLETHIDTLAVDIQKRGEAVRGRRNFLGHKTLRGRLLRAAALFRDNLRTLEQLDLESFADFLFERAVICEIRVASAGLARQIFVTTNDRGLTLNQADVFKSQLASIASSEDGSAQILERWKDIDAASENKEQFIGFLTAADFLTRRRWPGGGGLTDLGDYLIAEMSEAGILTWLDTLKRYQDAWRLLYDVRRPQAEQAFDGNLLRLHFFPWPEWRPLALVYLGAWQAALRQNQTQRAFRIAEWISRLNHTCMAMVLAGMGEAARQAVFRKAITAALNLADPYRANGPLRLNTDQLQRLKHALVAPIEDADVARQLTRWYESQLWGKTPPSYLLVKTLEHVLPRYREANSDWNRCFPDEAVHRRMSHMTGNFTLLDYDLNEQAGRADFAKKKSIYGQEKQLLKTLLDVQDRKEWTPSTIEQRSAEMARNILSFLGISDEGVRR
jgi:hypothetical protein